MTVLAHYRREVQRAPNMRLSRCHGNVRQRPVSGNVTSTVRDRHGDLFDDDLWLAASSE